MTKNINTQIAQIEKQIRLYKRWGVTNFVPVAERHTTHFNAETIKQELGLARDQFGDFMRASRKLAKMQMKNADAEKFVGDLLIENRAVFSEDVRKTKPFQKIMNLFNGQAIGIEEYDTTGNAWGSRECGNGIR